MAHWYRDPKRVNLMEHLDRAGIGFVLRLGDFSENDLLNLRTTLYPMMLEERLMLGMAIPGDRRKVLIIAPQESPDHSSLQNSEPWAGIFILPAHHSQREHALRALLTNNRSFENGARGCRVLSRGMLRRFVLNLRSFPPSLYGVRGIV